MNDRFAQYDPTAWTEEQVLLVRPRRPAPSKRSNRRAPNQSALATVGLSFALAAATAVSFGPSIGGAGRADEAVLIARERVHDSTGRAGPKRDVVPDGYWKALSDWAARAPVLDDDDDDDTEPFI